VWDFGVDHITARGFLNHVNPFTESGALQLGLSSSYGPAGSGHPPTTSFWALPFAAYPLEQANVILAAVTLLCLFTELVGTMGALGWPQVFSLAWIAFAFLVSCSFMRYHLVVGQFSAAIGFLYYVAWRAGRRGDQWLCGVAIGLACTMKLFPGVFGLFFLATRRWRAIAGLALAYLTVAAIMTSRYGLASWPFFLAKQPGIVRFWLGSIQNQSIHGVVLRFFSPVCGPRGAPTPLSTGISTALAFALLGGAAWLTMRRSRTRAAFDVSFALFVTLSVVTSQWAWEHYLVIYVLPTLILIDSVTRQ
jgi:hypothetical protein